jgi:hypothetical protein
VTFPDLEIRSPQSEHVPAQLRFQAVAAGLGVLEGDGLLGSVRA